MAKVKVFADKQTDQNDIDLPRISDYGSTKKKKNKQTNKQTKKNP